MKPVQLEAESRFVPIPGGGMAGVAHGRVFPAADFGAVFADHARRMRWNRVAARCRAEGLDDVEDYLAICELTAASSFAVEDDRLAAEEVRRAVAWAQSGHMDLVPRLEAVDPHDAPGGVGGDDGVADWATRLPQVTVDVSLLRAYT